MTTREHIVAEAIKNPIKTKYLIEKAEAREHLETAWQSLTPETAAGLSLAALGATPDDDAITAVEQRLKAAIGRDRRSSLLVVCLADL